MKSKRRRVMQDDRNKMKNRANGCFGILSGAAAAALAIRHHCRMKAEKIKILCGGRKLKLKKKTKKKTDSTHDKYLTAIIYHHVYTHTRLDHINSIFINETAA